MPRFPLFVGVLAMVVVLASCARTESGKPEPEATGPLAGWQLTLPVPGPKGDAQIVNPAVVSPPWLTTDPAGGLVFWAPVRGVTTKKSEHARTELDRLDTFAAGSGARTLTASVAVTQLPTAVPEVIIGQIHGAADISSVPFVMLYYAGGTVRAVVKQEQAGAAHTDIPLLTDVGLGTRFDYTVTDVGDGTLGVTATANGHTAHGEAPVPAAFSGATVRFQAGAYQQAPSSESAPDTEGARVTFSSITVGPKT
jgi:Alginate lyase